MKNSRIKNKTVGQVRYFSYFLEFPDGEHWVQSIPFVHELSFQLHQTSFGKIPEMYRSMIKNGECHWKDQNGVTHRVIVEESPREKKWGIKKHRPPLQLV